MRPPLHRLRREPRHPCAHRVHVRLRPQDAAEARGGEGQSEGPEEGPERDGDAGGDGGRAAVFVWVGAVSGVYYRVGVVLGWVWRGDHW